MNAATGMFLHIDPRCLDEGGFKPDADLFDCMYAIADIAKDHMQRLGDMDVGASEMILTHPVKRTWQVLKLKDEHYVTPEAVVPFD